MRNILHCATGISVSKTQPSFPIGSYREQEASDSADDERGDGIRLYTVVTDSGVGQEGRSEIQAGISAQIRKARADLYANFL